MSKKKNMSIAHPEPDKTANRKITLGRITKDKTMHIEYTIIRNDGTHFDYKLDIDGIAHKDLIEAFKKLRGHFVHMADLREIKKNFSIEDYNDEAFDHLDVNQFEVSGNGDAECVTVKGTKKLEGGVIKITSLPKYWTGSYEHLSELGEAIETLKAECLAYLDGKYAVKQEEMEFSGTEMDNDESKVVDETKAS